MLTRRLLAAATLVVVATSVGHGSSQTPAIDGDPIAVELSRLKTVLAGPGRTDPAWVDVKGSAEAVVEQIEGEMGAGRRLVALERLSALNQLVGGALYASERPETVRKDLAAFEAEWKRVGAILSDVVTAGGAADAIAADVKPALARAVAELTLSQAREHYHAALDYGQNTEPQFGLYYLGAAQSQRTFLDRLRAWSPASAASAPPLRGIRAEIDALQGELLAAYRPPASIARHSEFIVASAALKEAREQDASGHVYAALLRYLQAAQRTALLRESPAADTGAIGARLDSESARMRAARVDHTIGEFFIERARSALAAGDAAGRTTAAILADNVLPRYFAALEPARATTPPEEPRVTVTLVRWPFT